MCHDWWDERLLEERYRLAQEDAAKLKRSTESLVPSPKPKPDQTPERQTETQPEAVPV